RLLRLICRISGLAKRSTNFDRDHIEGSRRALEIFKELGAVVEIEGLDYLRAVEKPCVIVANHMSALETWTLPAIVYPIKKLSFVVKQSLTSYPVFGVIMRALDPIVVSRKNARSDLQTVLVEGERRLAAGKCVVVFPQTTRTLFFDASQFNSIGIKLARRAGVPVVPLALKTNAWGSGKLVKDFGPLDPEEPIRFHFGPALRITDSGRKAHEKTVEFISARLAEWQMHA
ncbi:1-acyl-sn-glycerol-3-phosphate acyltransferase, partial [candidate division KSB1 bacterium]|nr:1-acyl-sn-glycerol-3-phosphate acyltransferase [candidate division KSB1 bacterium]